MNYQFGKEKKMVMKNKLLKEEYIVEILLLLILVLFTQ